MWDTYCIFTYIVVTRTRGSWVPSPNTMTEAGERVLLLKSKRPWQSPLLLWWSNLIFVVVNEYYKIMISRKVSTEEPLFADCSSGYVVWVPDTERIPHVDRRQTQNTERSAACHHISHSSLLPSPWTKKIQGLQTKQESAIVSPLSIQPTWW
jgi:hypothetical protein